MYVKYPEIRSPHCSLLLAFSALILISPAAWGQQDAFQHITQNFVFVNVTTSTTSPNRLFKDLTIQNNFPSTGIVMDDRNHVVTFLGYLWEKIRSENPRVEMIDSQGQKRGARIVGIDQSTTIAVLEYEGKPLRKTQLCENCEHKDIATVVLPPQDKPMVFRLETSPIISVSTGLAAAGAWTVQISRPLTLIGGPLLDSKQRVLGVVSDQDVEAVPSNLRVTISILTTTQVLNSANKIIKVNGDIVTGWLGVQFNVDYKAGVWVTVVEPDSPAQKAGIRPGDILKKWNGVAISDYHKCIEIVENTTPGTKADIEVLRDGKPVKITAVIEARRQPRP